MPEPAAILQALLSLPLFSLVLALIAAGILTLVRRPQPVTVPVRYRGELRALGAVALGVIAVFAVENVLRGYVLTMVNVVDWWVYPTPILAAAIGIAAVGVLVAVRGSAAPERPAAPPTPRTWTTFGTRAGIVLLAIAIGALLATSIASGLASSPDEHGRYIYLEVGAPNTTIEPLRPWFYGWAYGIPVIVALAVLAVTVGLTLSRNATRPYLRADSVTSEKAARRIVAAAVVGVALGATLLALGGVLRFIARGGTFSQVTIGDNETYELVWRYAALAAAGGGLAPLLEIAGFALLVVTAVHTLRRRATAETRAMEVSR